MDTLIKESLQFAQEFDVDKYGLIINPGKFEREVQYTPYFYNLTMHSAQDDIKYIDDWVYDVFNVTQSDRELFPDLIGIDKVSINTDNNGFVSLLHNPDFGG